MQTGSSRARTSLRTLQEIEGRSAMNKDELIAALRQHSK